MEIAIIFALILLNGVFAMSEMALVSSRKAKLKKDAKEGNKSAERALRLSDDPNKFLSTVQIGITSIGILTGIYSGETLTEDLSVIFVDFGFTHEMANTIAQTIIVILVTYFTLILGELIPKRLGMVQAERIAKAVSMPMHYISWLASPFVWLLTRSSEFIFFVFRIKDEKSKVTEEEVKMLLQESKEDGEIKEVEQDIVERVFLVGDMNIGSIMTHRSEINWLDVKMTTVEIKEELKKDVYEVYPVASENLDNVMGVVYLKDIVRNMDKEKFDLLSILRDANFFYEKASVYSVLETLRTKKLNYALVCDEFGDFQGIITLKDVLEALVGYIDNSPNEADIVQREGLEEWYVDGQCSFGDFLSYFDMEHLYSSNNFNTVSGLMLHLLEHIPSVGEKVEWNEFVFEVVDMDKVRIDKLLVYKTERSV